MKFGEVAITTSGFWHTVLGILILFGSIIPVFAAALCGISVEIKLRDVE